MSNRKRKSIIKKLQDIQNELPAITADPMQQQRILQANKLIFCAEKILSQKDLIPLGKKAGEKH
jgi:hypothetical protein